MPLPLEDSTARIQALEQRVRLLQRALSESEAVAEEWSHLFDVIPDAALIIGRDGTVLAANERVAETIGEAPQSLIGQRVSDWGVWRNDAAHESIRETMARGEPLTNFATRMNLGNEVRDVLISGRPCRFKGDVAYLIYARDVTDYGTQLAEVQAVVEQAFEANPHAAMMVTYPEGVFVTVNSGFTRITGHTADEVTGHSSAELGIWGDLDQRQRFIQLLHDQGQVTDFYATIVCRDGRDFLGRISAGLITRDGQHYSVVDMSEVTSATELRRKTREAEELIGQLFDASPSAIGILRLVDNNLLSVNKTWASLFGVDIDAMPSPFDFASHWVNQGDHDRLNEQLSREGRITGFEAHLKQADGAVVPVMISAEMADLSGDNCVLLYVDDTTQIKRMEAQLLQSRKMEAIGQLAGGIAHDFNNLLGGISGFAELVRLESDPASDASSYAERIVETTQLAAERTNQLLLFARRVPLEIKPVDLHDVIHKAMVILQASLDRRVSIERVLRAGSAYVSGDATQIENALLNLCINASDAMPGGGTLTIETAQVTLDRAFCTQHDTPVSPGQHVRLSVRDTGVGIGPDVQAVIFEPFFTTKGAERGTGLGLAAVHGTVIQLHGAIEIESEVGKGTAFHLYLPASTRPTLYATTNNDSLVQGQGRILVVDDEPAIRDLASTMLERLGYDIQVAKDGHEALEVFNEDHESIDLVLLDMNMPKLNGMDVYPKLKEIHPRIPVAIMSGYSDFEDLKRLSDSGVCGHLRKPFRMAELSQLVDSALRRTKKRRSTD